MHPNVKRGGIEPPLLTAYPSHHRLTGRRGAFGVFAKTNLVQRGGNNYPIEKLEKAYCISFLSLEPPAS